jgi:hypothetical protein
VILPYQDPTPAVIVNLSTGGCQLRLDRPLELSDRFVLQFRSLAYVCEKRWSKDIRVGVQFLEPCPLGRLREVSKNLAPSGFASSSSRTNRFRRP